MNPTRRGFLKVLGGAAGAAAVGSPLFQAFAGPGDPVGSMDEFFVLIHAQGAWDVTLSLDPRNERRGLVEPGSTDYCDVSAIRRWQDSPLDADTKSFQIIEPAGTSLRLGPTLGNLIAHASRLTVVNGLAMNTVSHPDGTVFAATGRHLAGGRPVAASIDTMLANEVGRDQLFPSVSVQFPSAFVGSNLDPRAMPLRIASVDTVSRVLTRYNGNTTVDERTAVNAVLSQEADTLLQRSWFRDTMLGFKIQYGALERMLASNLQAVFQASTLQAAQPSFNYRARFQTSLAINAAFAVEAMKRNSVRCVSFASSSFDTHGTNYRNQALIQQELFDALAALVDALDLAPHPTLSGHKLSEHTHIMVVSDFCRTPQINLSGGRDHYPNGSALVISPRFRAGRAFGASDVDQLLPARSMMFSDGMRAVTPPDLLSTLLHAFGIEHRRYLRDGEPMTSMLVG